MMSDAPTANKNRDRYFFVVIVGGVDFDFAEAAVFELSGGVVVADLVLAAELLGNLVEGLFEFFLGRDLNGTAAGFVGKLFRDIGAPASAGIVHEQNVHN